MPGIRKKSGVAGRRRRGGPAGRGRGRGGMGVPFTNPPPAPPTRTVPSKRKKK